MVDSISWNPAENSILEFEWGVVTFFCKFKQSKPLQCLGLLMFSMVEKCECSELNALKF